MFRSRKQYGMTVWQYIKWQLKWQLHYADEDTIRDEARHPHLALKIFVISLLGITGLTLGIQEYVWAHTSTAEPICYVENYGSYNNRVGSSNATVSNNQAHRTNRSFGRLPRKLQREDLEIVARKSHSSIDNRNHATAR